MFRSNNFLEQLCQKKNSLLYISVYLQFYYFLLLSTDMKPAPNTVSISKSLHLGLKLNTRISK